MSRSITLVALVIVTALSQFAAGAVSPSPRPEGSRIYNGKSVYLPAGLASNDFADPASKWSFSRMAQTENVVLFWADGFGANPAKAPDLDGHNMKVDINNLLARLEQFFRFFYSDLAWVKPGSNADSLKMMAMLDYSLEGTAYGGDYDGQIGALWITPNRVQDDKLNCIAHELGHSFQSQITCDGEGMAWGGHGIFEMASQWMLWQVNPDWPTDEKYHLDAFRNLTHKAFLHIDNIYHSPYVLECWGELHGPGFIAELFRQGRTDEDPVMTYKRMCSMGQEQFNDEMFRQQSRFVNWDFDRTRANMRPYANQWSTPLEPVGRNRYRVPAAVAPENYGFNFIELTTPAPGTGVTVDFKGETALKGYNNVNPSKAGWRYGFIAVDADGNTVYGPMHSGRTGRLIYTAPESAPLQHLWLMVMGAPTEYWRNVDGPENPGDAQWPYTLTFRTGSPKAVADVGSDKR